MTQIVTEIAPSFLQTFLANASLVDVPRSWW